MRAVAGPAAEAGLEFKLVASEMTTWADWVARYPETTVLSLDTGHRRNYFLPPYQNYFMTDTIGYGAHGNPERRPDLKNKDRIVVAEVGDERRIYVVKDVAEATADGRPLRDLLGGVELDISYVADADTVRIKPSQGEAEVHLVYSFWFAWEELYPGVDIWSPK